MIYLAFMTEGGFFVCFRESEVFFVIDLVLLHYITIYFVSTINKQSALQFFI